MIKGILKGLHLAPRILFAVWLFGVLLLFLPDSVAEALAISSPKFPHESSV